MNVDMASLCSRRQHNLAGAPTGRQALAALLAKTTQEPLSPEPLYLDFADVQIATASYLRESVLRFRDAMRMQGSNLYPIIANANSQVIEELALLIQASGNVLMTCSLDPEGAPQKAKLIGDLDPKQKMTFELVNSMGETDASELMREYGASENVKQTAWNNRLASLAGMGLVFELSQGRTKRYKRLFEKGAYGD